MRSPEEWKIAHGAVELLKTGSKFYMFQRPGKIVRFGDKIFQLTTTGVEEIVGPPCYPTAQLVLEIVEAYKRAEELHQNQ